MHCSTADEVVGKPSVYLQEFLHRYLAPLPAVDAVMVGDRIDTDIAFGNACGMRTALVLTGVSTAADVSAPRARGAARECGG